MELIKVKFNEIKNSDNPDLINDFLIELSENPSKEHLGYLNHFIESTDAQILNKIKLNLMYLLGEIGNLTPLPDDFLKLIVKEYYKSDRWIRNEIIQAISKISKKSELNEKAVELLSTALIDEYIPIKISTLKLLLNFKNLPDKLLTNLIRIMNSDDSEILEGCRRIFERFPQQSERIFRMLNINENYKNLKSRGIRSLLLIQFKSIMNVESFREMIVNSKWDEISREKYLKELDTFERILLKNM